jgi:hypothetical protein
MPGDDHLTNGRNSACCVAHDNEPNNGVNRPTTANGTAYRHQPYELAGQPMLESCPSRKSGFAELKPWVQVDGQWIPRQCMEGVTLQPPYLAAPYMLGGCVEQGLEYHEPSAVKTTERREKKEWVQIDTSWMARSSEMATFPAGFKVSVYDGRLTSYFEIPSEHIVPTHGGMRYVEYFNETGPYSRFRFQLCHNFLLGRCNKGFTCTYIHAKQVPKAQSIHVQGLDAYERLPPGISVFVDMPGSTGQPQLIPSENIVRTLGAERLYAEIIDNKQGTFVRPQHCAHFMFKKLCNRGPNCAFIHALMPRAPIRVSKEPVSH